MHEPGNGGLIGGNGGTAEVQVRPKNPEWESEEAGKEKNQ